MSGHDALAQQHMDVWRAGWRAGRADTEEAALAAMPDRAAEIDRIASVLRGHWPDPVFGCECTPEDDETGTKARLSVPWERHVAELVVT